MATVVLTALEANARASDALRRAVERFPATIETVAAHERVHRIAHIASRVEVEWIVLVDEDVVPRADAFGGLRRALDAGPAIVGGRALVGGVHRFGAMLAAPRSGPNAFEVVGISGSPSDRALTDVMRGPVDVPQRGMLVVAADFIRRMTPGALDPVLFQLDLALHARAAGRAVLCEPSMAFTSEEDTIDVRRALANLRQFNASASFAPGSLHRDPPALRAAVINREVRMMGNFRGYARRAMPPVDIFVTAGDDLTRTRALRDARALRTNGGTVGAFAPEDGDALRRALSRTGDRYLLVCAPENVPVQGVLEVLVERVERSGRFAVALERDDADGAALFHCGRIVNGGAIPGGTVAQTIAHAIEMLPERRLFAVAPGGAIVPRRLRALQALRTLDIVFVAASRPQATSQTVRALVQEPVEGAMTAVYPAGAQTTRTIVGTIADLKLLADDSDPHLAIGLNRALATVSGDGVLIVRDDVQLPKGFIRRMRDAFRRIPRLGAVVPRVGGSDRPEGLPDLAYRSSADMQSFADRRGESFAREAMLVDVATTPVILVTREALDVIGGFDERFGFSRIGIEDFTRRLRAANFHVARCDDAYAHLFPIADAQSFLGSIDDDPVLRAAYEARWSGRAGFDPERDRVAFRAAAEPVAASPARRLRVLVPVADVEEWGRARPFIAELAGAFRAGDPLDVVIGLDGAFGVQSAVRAIREILSATSIPLELTLNMLIEPVADLATWRDEGAESVRWSATERETLTGLATVDGAVAVRARLGELG